MPHLDEAKILDAGLEELRLFLENSYPMVRQDRLSPAK
jgi:hypothetical protein